MLNVFERAPTLGADAQHALESAVARLNRASVQKRFEAYRDVDWDAPEYQVDPRDPRFRLPASNPLSQSAWYAALPESTQAALGLDMMCQALKYGIGFESALSRGLLEVAHNERNESPIARYAFHEIIEESHHSLMFQEFINRAGCDPVPLRGVGALVQRLLSMSSAGFPELFFFCTLAGEIFIDHDNRMRLADGEKNHPLVRRIMQIHVTEEARHVRFAELYLDAHLPYLSAARRRALRAFLPKLFDNAQFMMLQPSGRLRARYGIPRDVLKACFGRGSAHRERVEMLAAPVLSKLDGPALPKLRVYATA